MKNNFTLNILLAIAGAFYMLMLVCIFNALATKPASASITHCVQIPDLKINADHVTVKLICDDKGQQCELIEIVKLEPKTYFSPLSTECN